MSPGLYPAGVLCELVNDDGSMARGQSLETFADLYGLVMISIDDLVAYGWRTEALVTREASAALPTRYGAFEIVGYRSMTDDSQHVALVMGEVKGKVDVLTRIHSVCLTGDVFGCLRCDCGPQLEESMRQIAEEGLGVIVYNTTHDVY